MHWLRTLVIVTMTCPLTAVVAKAAPPRGEAIYAKQCASCHGLKGEGAKGYPKPLAGDLAVAPLAKLIGRTMPEDAPGSLSDADAEVVAKYVHETFYSVAARDSQTLPRIELARLTVPQYRATVADIVSSFRGQTPAWGTERGLKGEYYNSRNFQFKQRIEERTDAVVEFDFKNKSPIEGKIEPHEFAIAWTGSVMAPESGEVEFVVKSDQAIRLWVNDMRKPLIDATVKSGTDTEYKAPVYLLAGRPVGIRLEFSKAKQGVADKKAKEKPPTPAHIQLAWKRPGRAIEPIAARFLSPTRGLDLFVPTVPFPPDDKSYGWPRGTAVSKEWDAATTDAALETTGYITTKINDLANTKDDAKDRPAKLKEFTKTFATRAFRRPLFPDELARYVERPFSSTTDVDTGLKRALILILKSPRFLYREIGGQGDAYDVANRLAYALWDGPPDTELMAAANTNKLATRDQVLAQAKRMVKDPRAIAKLQSFFTQWLKLDHAGELSKDPKRFPDFTPEVAADLHESFDLLLSEILRSDKADFKQLFQMEEVYLNGRLAKVYGAELPADAAFTKVKMPKGDQAGVLTHPYVLATLAYTAESSPIHRGVLLYRGVLGHMLRPPPDAFTPLAADLHPTLTTRERVSLQTKPASCSTCHNMINPLGFVLENYDAIGRYRTEERGKPIDAKGQYLTRAGITQTFTGPKELAKFLADSPDVQASFAEQLFHHLAQQSIRAYGADTKQKLWLLFEKSGYNVLALTADAATTAALTGRPTESPAPKPK